MQEGIIDRKWVDDYCLIDNHECIRYQMEEKGIPHSNYMLPDGKMLKNLNRKDF